MVELNEANKAKHEALRARLHASAQKMVDLSEREAAAVMDTAEVVDDVTAEEALALFGDKD